MPLKLPKLEILEVKNLAVHEHHDGQRTPALIERLRTSGLLRNPPIVTPLQDGSGRYMVLDGTNRTTALRKMGLPHAIAQVVESDSPNLDLKTWNHVLWGLKSDELINGLKEIKELNLQTSDEDLAGQWKKQALAWIQTANGKTYTGMAQSHDLVSIVKMLNNIVDSYKDRAKIDRTRAKTVGELNGLYRDLCAVVVFPPFEIADLLELCSQGNLMPTGTTRFIISPRALRVNYAIDDLAAEKSLEEKNSSLEIWIQERVARKGVRIYSEATVLYDE
ncbi:MAG: ParB N-terminal domain-containing protein [Chloroflexi bacterium]|nr:ParB N-terminal domain-containing protein [Chloroflexota bacterium]